MNQPDILDRPRSVLGTKLILGLFFTVIGLLLTVTNLGILPLGSYLRYWPAVILLIGLIKLADPAGRVPGLILTFIGAAMLASKAGWLRVNVFDLWPLLLIAVGIGMVMRALGLRGSADATLAESTAEGEIWAVLSNQKLENSSKSFSGARITAVMGGCELDLTGADIPGGSAVVEVFAMWSGIEITVPDGWDIIGDVVPVMAGFEVVSSAAATTPRRQLVIRGTAVMAGIEVKRRRS